MRRLAALSIVIGLLSSAGCVDDPLGSSDLTTLGDAAIDASSLDGPGGDLDAASADLGPAADLTPSFDLAPISPVLTRTESLVGGRVADVGVYDANTMYALAAGYLWRFNFGSWSRLAPFPNGVRVAVAYSGPNLVAVASRQTGSSRIEQSTDGGSSFSMLANLTMETPFLTYVPEATNNLWALDAHKLVFWDESGTQWRDMFMSGKTANHVASSGGETLLATSEGVLRRNVANWDPLSPATTSALWVSVDATDGMRVDMIGTTAPLPTPLQHFGTTGTTFADCKPSAVPKSVALVDGLHFAGFEDHVEHRSSLGCGGTATWATELLEPYGGAIGWLKKGTAAETVVASTSFGVAVASSSTGSFALQNAGLYALHVWQFSVDRTSGDLLAATESGAYQSADGGGNWTRLTALAHTPTDFLGRHDQLLLAASGARRFYSINTGGTFQDPGTGYPSPSYAADPFVNGRYYLCDGGALAVSTNGGIAFTKLVPDNGQTPSCILVATSPTQAGVLWILRTAATAMRSTDSGATWFDTGIGLPGEVIKQLAVDPLDGARAWVLQSELRRIDNQLTTIATPGGAPMTSFAIDPVIAGRVYVTSSDGLFWSHDGGMTFAKLRSEPGHLVFVNPMLPGNVLFATNADGVLVAK